MRTIKINKKLTILLSGMLMMLLFLPFNSSAKKVKFNNSSIVPAAEGYVKVKKDSNKNYLVKIYVTNLAAIERMESSKLTYVIWMQTEQGKAENLGQLVSSSGMFSTKLKASLETVTSFRPVKVFITTESEINVQYPGSQVVLTTDNF